MGSQKIIFVIALQLVLEGCCVFSQGIQCPQTFSCTSTPFIPAGQFVIPAIIKPILQPEVSVQNTAPAIPNYPGDFGYGGLGFPGGFPGSSFGGFPGPFGGMPPIIFDDSDDDRSYSWLFYLILALSRRGRFGGGYGGNGNGYGGGYGNCGGCSGGCGGGSYGCSGCGCGCSNCGYNSYNGGYNGGCGCGSFGGFSGNNCGCNGCTYIPYPVPVPCGSSTCCASASGSGNFESPYDENYTNQGYQSPQEINLRILTEQTPPQ